MDPSTLHFQLSLCHTSDRDLLDLEWQMRIVHFEDSGLKTKSCTTNRVLWKSWSQEISFDGFIWTQLMLSSITSFHWLYVIYHSTLLLSYTLLKMHIACVEVTQNLRYILSKLYFIQVKIKQSCALIYLSYNYPRVYHKCLYSIVKIYI